MNCLSFQVEVYPDRELDEGPFCLKDKTLIYPQRTELLFDLQTETDNDDDNKQDSRYQGSPNSVGYSAKCVGWDLGCVSSP